MKLQGEPLEVGRALGEYANKLIRGQAVPDFTLAKVLLSAYRVFRLHNPDMTRKNEADLSGESDGLIVSPYN